MTRREERDISYLNSALAYGSPLNSFSLHAFQCHFLHAQQIQLAGAQDGHFGHLVEIALAGNPEVGQALFAEEPAEHARFRAVERKVEHDEAFTLAFVGDGGHGQNALGGLQDVVQVVLDFFERHHFATYFGEAGKAPGNRDEAVGVNLGHVAGGVPTVADDLARQFVAAEVTLHDVGAEDEQQTFLTMRPRFVGVRTDHAGGHAGERLANGADLVAYLAEAADFLVRNVGGDGGREFGAA